MRDIIMLATLIGTTVLFAGYIAVCDSIVGPDEPRDITDASPEPSNRVQTPTADTGAETPRAHTSNAIPSTGRRHTLRLRS